MKKLLFVTCLIMFTVNIGLYATAADDLTLRLESLKHQTEALVGTVTYEDHLILRHVEPARTRGAAPQTVMTEEEVYDEDYVFEILSYIQTMHRENPDVMTGERLEYLEQKLNNIAEIFEMARRSSLTRSGTGASIDETYYSMLMEEVHQIVEEILMPDQDFERELLEASTESPTRTSAQRSPETPRQLMGIVTVNTSANVRSGPSTNYRILRSVPNGTEVSILERRGNWLYVRLPENLNGYIHDSLVRIVETPDIPEEEQPSVPEDEEESDNTGTITASVANIRTGPGTNHRILTALTYGTEVHITGRQGNWYQIRIPDGRIGYVYANLLHADEVATDTRRGRVTVSAANVRRSASLSAARVTTIQRGDVVTILGQTGSWYHIRIPDGRTGYCHTNLIQEIDDTTAATPSPPPAQPSPPPAQPSPDPQPSDDDTISVVNVSSANVRSGPSTNYRVITSLSRGTRVKVLGQRNSWLHIEMPDGRKGYMYYTLLSSSAQSAESGTDGARRITSSALGAVGSRGVVYGRQCYYADTAHGRLACAAVVSEILRHARVGYSQHIIYTPTQRNYLRNIGFREITNRQYRAGDVVFWTLRAGDRTRHVGIIVERDIYGSWWTVDNSSAQRRVVKRPLVRSYYPIILPVWRTPR